MKADIMRIVADALARSSVESDVSLYDYGMDSFAALRIRSEIREATGTSLPMTDLLGDVVTVDSLVEAIESGGAAR